MLGLNAVQASLITRLKANAALVAALGSAGVEVRETQWQGNDFAYPAVRVRCGPLAPGNMGCPYAVDVVIGTYSEQASSKQSEDLATLVATCLDDQRWTDATQKARFAGINLLSIQPPYRRDQRTWIVEIRFRAIVSEAP